MDAPKTMTVYVELDSHILRQAELRLGAGFNRIVYAGISPQYASQLAQAICAVAARSGATFAAIDHLAELRRITQLRGMAA